MSLVINENRRKVIRKVYGIRISDDYGKTWRVRALCEECYRQIEPPKMAKKEIEAGAYSCDWCGCRNEMYVRGKDGKS